MATTPASTPFTPGRELDYEVLWQHLLQIIHTLDPSISASTSRNEPLPSFVLESLGNIALVLNIALRRFYPLRGVHKYAILSCIQQVFAWIDSSNASQRHLFAGTTLSPTRQKALTLASGAKSADPRRWSSLCHFVDHARDVHAAMQQISDPESLNEDREVLNSRINEFLSMLKKMRAKLDGLFANLSTASLEPEDSIDVIIGALDRHATGEACTQDEAVTYLILGLPALNSFPDRSRDNRDLERHFAEQLRREYRGDAPAHFLRFVHKVTQHYTKSDQDGDFFDSYLKGTSIVQSSGTGKTRLVLELGKKAPSSTSACVARVCIAARASKMVSPSQSKISTNTFAMPR